MPYWQNIGRSNRFAVEPGVAASRSVSGIRFMNTGTASMSRSSEPPPTPTPISRPIPTSAARSPSLRDPSDAESFR